MSAPTLCACGYPVERSDLTFLWWPVETYRHPERRHGWLWDPAGRCYRHDEDSFTAVAVESSEFSRLVAATEERAP